VDGELKESGRDRTREIDQRN